MLKYVICVVATALLHTTLAKAQVGVEVQLRYDFVSELASDEFPPHLSFTLYTAPNKKVSFNIQSHVNLNYHKREWPNFGSYTQRTTQFGFGGQLQFILAQTPKWHVRNQLGMGLRTNRYRLKSEQEIIEEFVILPKDHNNLYAYMSFGFVYNMSQKSQISLVLGVGAFNLALGYSYLFNANHERK